MGPRADAPRCAAPCRGGPPATLLEIDYLLRVSDFGRLGALRFSTSEHGPFLAPDDVAPIPPLVELPALLAASDDVLANDESDALRVLLAPGSSLGGARPKASVRDVDGALAVAKFPARTDEVGVVRWEAVALLLAERAGIDVPQRRLETIGNAPVLLLRRFDRRANARVPFLSAMAALGAADHERRSYPEFVDFIRQHGAHPKQDLHALWRRMVFNVLISNTDDHLRNHGFLHVPGRGWTLSPAYDLNPTPTDLKPRVLATARRCRGCRCRRCLEAPRARHRHRLRRPHGLLAAGLRRGTLLRTRRSGGTAHRRRGGTGDGRLA